MTTVPSSQFSRFLQVWDVPRELKDLRCKFCKKRAASYWKDENGMSPKEQEPFAQKQASPEAKIVFVFS